MVNSLRLPAFAFPAFAECHDIDISYTPSSHGMWKWAF